MVGRTLNHYRIVRKLGSGGMGEVYEAEDTRLGRRIALKVLPPELAAHADRLERFEREAKAVAALNHPNIVTIHSVEESEGVHFITMELVEGSTLGQKIPRGGMSLRQVLEIALPLADALAAAHQQGITHRDLKPENVIVGRDGRVKVLDFGLAKLHGALSDAEGGTRVPTVSLTEEGRIVGTVAYMSPEQAEGKPVDPRSDVFSIGILLYEMSTGERPFRGDTAVSIISSILKDTPRPITELNRELPRELGRIVNRCLAKDPMKRFQSALGLGSELATLKQESDSGDLPGVAAEARAAATSSNKSVWIAGIVAIGLVGALAIYGTLFRDRSGRAPAPPTGATGAAPAVHARQKIVILPFENLGSADDEYFAAGVTEEITSRLASIRDLGVISRSSAVQYARTGKTIREIGEELGVDYVLEGTVRWDRRQGGSSRVRVTPQLIRVADDTHLWSDRYDRVMEDIFDVQTEIASKVVEQLGLAVGQPEGAALGSKPTENLEAYQVYLRGKDYLDRPDSERTQVERAVQMFQRAVDLDPEFASAWSMLSQTHSRMYHYRYDFSEDRLSLAREAADRALRLRPDLSEAHVALGYYYYWGRRDYDHALEELTEASKGRENDPEILEAIAYIRRRQGFWDEALANLEKAFQLNPRSANLAGALAGTYGHLRRYDDAARYYDIALDLAPDSIEMQIAKAFTLFNWKGDLRAMRQSIEKLPPSNIPMLPYLFVFLDFMEGDHQAALDRLDGIQLEVLEDQSSFIPKPLLKGLIYLDRGDIDQARESCDAGREVLEAEIERRPQDPRVRASLGIALACLGRRDEAIREARLATDLYPLSRDALGGVDYLENLSQVYAMVGENEAALDLIEDLLTMPAGVSARFLEFDPGWSALRDHPRFRKLVEEHR